MEAAEELRHRGFAPIERTTLQIPEAAMGNIAASSTQGAFLATPTSFPMIDTLGALRIVGGTWYMRDSAQTGFLTVEAADLQIRGSGGKGIAVISDVAQWGILTNYGNQWSVDEFLLFGADGGAQGGQPFQLMINSALSNSDGAATHFALGGGAVIFEIWRQRR